MTKQRWLLLGGIAVCLALAGFFAGLSETESHGKEASSLTNTEEKPTIVFPREHPKKRSVRRAVNAPAKAVPEPASHAPEIEPIERAVFATNDGGAVFIEFSAIRNSSFVEKLIGCQSNELASEWEESVRQLGYDWRKDIDRIAISADVLAMSGFFENAKIPDEFGAGESYGERARIFQPDPASAARYVMVDQNLIVMAKNLDAAREMVDRVEGRIPVTTTAYPHMMENEVYGKISTSMLSSLFAQDTPLAADVQALVDHVSLRMEVDDYLSMSLDVESKDAEKSADLAKSVGGLLALARREAELAGDHELASLLEEARVLPGENGRFGIDFAVPETWMLQRMGCDGSGVPHAAKDGKHEGATSAFDASH